MTPSSNSVLIICACLLLWECHFASAAAGKADDKPTQFMPVVYPAHMVGLPPEAGPVIMHSGIPAADDKKKSTPSDMLMSPIPPWHMQGGNPFGALAPGAPNGYPYGAYAGASSPQLVMAPSFKSKKRSIPEGLRFTMNPRHRSVASSGNIGPPAQPSPPPFPLPEKATSARPTAGAISAAKVGPSNSRAAHPTQRTWGATSFLQERGVGSKKKTEVPWFIPSMLSPGLMHGQANMLVPGAQLPPGLLPGMYPGMFPFGVMVPPDEKAKNKEDKGKSWFVPSMLPTHLMTAVAEGQEGAGSAGGADAKPGAGGTAALVPGGGLPLGAFPAGTVYPGLYPGHPFMMPPQDDKKKSSTSSKDKDKAVPAYPPWLHPWGYGYHAGGMYPYPFMMPPPADDKKKSSSSKGKPEVMLPPMMPPIMGVQPGAVPVMGAPGAVPMIGGAVPMMGAPGGPGGVPMGMHPANAPMMGAPLPWMYHPPIMVPPADSKSKSTSSKDKPPAMPPWMVMAMAGGYGLAGPKSLSPHFYQTTQPSQWASKPVPLYMHQTSAVQNNPSSNTPNMATAPLQAAPNVQQAAGAGTVSAPNGGYSRDAAGQLPSVKYRDYGFQFRSKLRGAATGAAATTSTGSSTSVAGSTSGPAGVTSADALHLHCVSQCQKDKNKDACVKQCNDLRHLK